MSTSRLVCVTVLALALMAGASSASQVNTQDAAVHVIAMIYVPGAAPQYDYATIGDLEGGCQTSTVNFASDGPDGAPEPATPPTAGQEWALATVFAQCLQTPIPISAISQVTVIEPNGQPDLNSAAQLSPPDLTLPSDFADSTSWPIFWDTGSQVIYERPIRNASDDNVADMVIIQPGGSLQFDVFEGQPPATVTITASATSIKPGKTVSFTATLPGNPAGETYSWNVDGAAADSTGSNTSIQPNQSGVYDITVQATGPEDGFGSIVIKVGSPPSQTGTNTTSGPTQSAGNTPGAGAGKPKPGTGYASPKPKPKPKTRTTPKATATPVSGSGPAVSSTPAVSPTTTAQALTGAGAAGPRSAATGGSTTTVPTTTTTATTSTATKTTTAAIATTPATSGSQPGVSGQATEVPPASGPAATHTPKDVRVEGRLLGGVVALSSSPTLLTEQTSQGSALQLDKPGTGDPWPAIGLALGVLALLGLGATRELRSIRSEP